MTAPSAAQQIHEETAALYRQSHQEMLRLARSDFVTFVTYVMKDEHTNAPVTMQPFQVVWSRLCQQYDRLMILAFMESGKSFLVSVAMTLWELGRDPSLQFAIVSRTTRQAKKLSGHLARYIAQSKELREVFPWLRPDPNMPWNSEQLSVVRPGLSKDPSIQVVSIGRTIQGARIDRAILDDVLDRENTRIQTRRDDTWDWYQKSIPGRLTANAKVRAVGNPFHRQDLYHRLARNERWHAFRFPVLRPNGQSAWPEKWPLDRIEARRLELGDVFFRIQMMCEPVDLSAIGMMFRKDEVTFVDAIPPLASQFCRRWDLACTEPHEGNPDPDWTVGVKMAKTQEKKFLIADVERKRTRDPLGLVKRLATQDGQAVEVGIPRDPGQAGVDQVNTYVRELAGWSVWAETESGDKITRALSWSTQWQHGNVILLRGNWNDPFLSVMEAFPTPNIHDDDVDASGGGFRHLTAAAPAYTGNKGQGFHFRR